MVFRKEIVRSLLFAQLFIAWSAHAFSTALIYKGPGACEEKCSSAAALIALEAGMMPKYVGPTALDAKSSPAQVKALFKNVKVWIQPGGVSNEAYNTMTPELENALRDFIKEGGGYVGFCAGGFMATSIIGGTGEQGLGIFPGRTDLFELPPLPGKTFSMPVVTWNGQKRAIYFEGGPYFFGFDNASEKVEVIAKFESGEVAAARASFGKGRVFITGLHPEAPKSWTKEDGVKDPDGNDHLLAAEMVRWAGKK